MQEGVEMAVLPKRERPVGPFVTTSVRLPKELLEDVDALAGERGYSRNETMWRAMQIGVNAIRGELASTEAVQESTEETRQLREQVQALLAEVQQLKKSRSK